MSRLLTKITDTKQYGAELPGIDVNIIVAFLKQRSAVHLNENWFPDLQLDEIEVDGETIILIQETWMDPVLSGREEFVKKLKQEIMELADPENNCKKK